VSVNKQFTKEEAVAFYESKEWEEWTLQKIAVFQLYQECLCVPFAKFHKGMEVLLDRPVWTHEFADQDALVAEYEGKATKATFGDVMNKLDKYTKDKVVIVLNKEKRDDN
jgi:hypothetical protein